MRIRMMLAGLAAAGLLAGPVAAQEQGQFQASLTRIMEEAGKGVCPAELMGAEVLAACSGQIEQMSIGLASLGAVQSVTFVRSEETPDGAVETYAVRYAGGQTLNWHIGQRQADGKFRTVGAGA